MPLVDWLLGAGAVLQDSGLIEPALRPELYRVIWPRGPAYADPAR